MASRILAEIGEGSLSSLYLKEAFKEAGLTAVLHRSKSAEERKKWLKEYEVLLPLPPLGEHLISAAERLRMVQAMGIGFDYVDIPALSKRGIILCNTGGFIAETVAEHGWALLMALARRVAIGHMKIAEGEHIIGGSWWLPSWGDEIYGKTIGLIGFGNIGRRVARMAKAFNMRVLAHDPYITEDAAELYSAELKSIEEVLKRSDFVCITMPLTEETRGLIGREEFNLMKRTAYIINVSRGAIIKEKELIQALKEEKIAGAGLDVFEVEPLPMNSPLRRLENVVLTPHFAGASKEASRRMFRVIAGNIKKFLEGGKPNWIVNLGELRRLGKLPTSLRP